jgi:hypothetical protein
LRKSLSQDYSPLPLHYVPFLSEAALKMEKNVVPFNQRGKKHGSEWPHRARVYGKVGE